MPDNKKNDSIGMDINVNVSYTNESDIVNGSINPIVPWTTSVTYPFKMTLETADGPATISFYATKEYRGSYAECNYNLQEWINDYKNGLSTEDILNKIKIDVKQNPLVIAHYLPILMIKYYDHDKNHKNTGTSAKEMLDIMLNVPEGEELNGFVCMNIHEFGMRLLSEVGIESVCICGKSEDSENHATLLYKNEDGTYTYMNYGDVYVVKAQNIKDAAREIYKYSDELEASGYITFINDEGSYQEFALKDEAVWGKEMDKRDYNSSTVFQHNIQSKPSIDINASLSNHLSPEITLGTTILKYEGSATKQYSLDLGFKSNNRMTSLADTSTSFGAKFNYDVLKKGTKIGDLRYGTKAVISETVLNFEPHTLDVIPVNHPEDNKMIEGLLITENDTNRIESKLEDIPGIDPSSPEIKDLLDKSIADAISNATYSNYYSRDCEISKNKSFNTSILSRSYVNSSDIIYKDNNNEIVRFNEINGMLGATADFAGEAACFGDMQVGTEHGLQTITRLRNTVFQNEVSIGVIGNLKLNGGSQIPSIMAGGKFNITSALQSMPAHNVFFGGSVSAYAVPTKAYTDIGAAANAYVSYKPTGSRATIFGAANVGYNQQTLHLGFKELTEQQTSFGGTFGVDFNKARVALSYQGLKDKVNPTRDTSHFSVNASIPL